MSVKATHMLDGSELVGWKDEWSDMARRLTVAFCGQKDWRQLYARGLRLENNMAKSATVRLPRGALLSFPAGKYLEAKIGPPCTQHLLFQAIDDTVAASLGGGKLGG